MSRPRAYQLIEAAGIASNLSTQVDNQRPVSEKQIRPLASLSPENQRTVWAQAVGSKPRVVDPQQVAPVRQQPHMR
jgi:hypothetical protein